LKGRVLFSEVTLPRELAFHRQSDKLTVSEPRVHHAAVGDRARARKVVLLMYRRELSFCRHSILPQRLAVGSAKCFNKEIELLFCRRGALRHWLFSCRLRASSQSRMRAAAQFCFAQLRSDENA